MKVVIKTELLDLFSFLRHLNQRKKIFRKGSKKRSAKGRMNILAGELHPSRQILIIDSIIPENDTTITYRLKPAGNNKAAYFRAGQYLSIDIDIHGVGTSRPFSISSTPEDVLNNNFYEITIKTNSDGFVSPYIRKHWKKGSIVYTSEPMGYFYYEPLRDSHNLVFLAGGTGITPFRSLIGDTLSDYDDVNIILYYGIHKPSDENYSSFFHEMEISYPGRFKAILVCEEAPEKWTGERGFITADLILKYVDYLADRSFFICGSQQFQGFIDNELKRFNIMKKFIRRDSCDISYKSDLKLASLLINVTLGPKNITVKSDPNESILVALERAGLNPAASCRTGECGLCRSKLISGQISVADGNDGRRMADKKFGYFHPCSSFALTDLEIVCPENPRKIIKEE